ncbi:choice-of-anchor D domain-containing protein [Microvenator marinus]|uniref:Choice-of-anchor D domain-containing protein n=1 Tax=Microvenator marinus TaxID=2600177 RepID=A0A5B8XTN0_9DELT|nr:choice-of-anchor D domain-containing protein [Microvenator marinus]QED27453.1 choice-of-anchor D domain-containing protein [Microvenator marinus]
MKWLSLVFVGLLAACSSDDGTSPGPRPMDMESDQAVQDADMNSPDVTVEPDMPQRPRQMEIDIPELLFDSVRIGESRTLTFAVTNLGDEDLVLTRADISQFNRTSEPEFVPGENWIDGTTIVEGQTFREFDVVYTPVDHETDRGSVTIISNDPDQATWEVRLETINPYPELEGPQLLKFGSVAANETATRRVNLYNRGRDPLTLNSIETTGSNRFSIALIPTEPLPRVVQRDELYAFDVVFSPNNTNVARGTIVINSDDPDEQPFEIAVSGNDPGPCMQVLPDTLDFGEVAPNTAQTQEITLFNCSNALDLEISGLEIVDGEFAFELVDSPELPITLNAFENVTLEVRANIEGPEAIGALRVENSDSNRDVELRVRTPEEE